MPETDRKSLLLSMFRAAIASADPAQVIAPHLPERPSGRCIVVGAGKASAAMARAVEQAWPDVDLRGIVATRHGHAADCQKIRIVEAGHPVPDAASMAAAQQMIAMLDSAGPDDLVLALISGGGSATLALPAEGLTLADKQAVTAALLRSGAPISDINRVRKAMSRVKGGRLARHAGSARIVSLIISDVPGDDPADIASGPTVQDRCDGPSPMDVLRRHGIAVSAAVKAALLAEPATRPEARPQDSFAIIASPAMALAAAADVARSAGYEVVNLGDRIEGDAAAVARDHAARATALARQGRRFAILSGGETTVTLPEGCDAKGGRNTEYQLALGIALQGQADVWSLAGDSDGIDGFSDAAGAIVTPDSLLRARSTGLDPQALLDTHRSHDFFAQLGDLVKTGPTLTNVNDIRIQLIG